MTRSSVDLPPPAGPNNAVIWLAAIDNVTSIRLSVPSSYV